MKTIKVKLDKFSMLASLTHCQGEEQLVIVFDEIFSTVKFLLFLLVLIFLDDHNDGLE